MKKLAALVILLFCAATLSAQDLPRIAVYVTGNVGDDEKKALGTRMLASLVNSKRYKGIERSNSFLAEIEKEQEKQRSGAIDDGQISALGKQFGVKFVCIADITPAFGEFQVSARIVNVETAEVEFIGESASPLKSMADLARVSDQVVKNMFGEETESTVKPKAAPKSEPPQVDTPTIADNFQRLPEHKLEPPPAATPKQDNTTKRSRGKPEESRVLQKRISLETGGIFSPYTDNISYGGGLPDSTGSSWGLYMCVDLIYVEGIVDVYRLSPVGILGVFVKYPIVYSFVKVSPIFGYGGMAPGISSSGLIFGGRIDVGITEIIYLRSEYLYLAGSGSATDMLGLGSGIKIGGGLDIGFGERSYLRGELLYRFLGAENSNDVFRYGDETHSIEIRLGIGYKWGGP